MGNGIKQKLILIQRLNSRSSLHFIAEAAAKRAISQMLMNPSGECDTLTSLWSNNPSKFKDVAVGHGQYSIFYDYIEYKSGKQQRKYGLIDEERKLNINKANINDIQRLVMLITGCQQIEAQSLAAAIVDWRDEDDSLSIPSGSAEDRYYRLLPAPYDGKDAAFEVLDELLLVKGITKEVFARLRNYVTIYGEGAVNINTASAQVLLALNLGKNLVDKIISYRLGEDRIGATDDDNFFTSSSNITDELDAFSDLSSSEVAIISNLVADGKLSTFSENFTVRAVAQLDKQKLELVCVIDKEARIQYWQEG